MLWKWIFIVLTVTALVGAEVSAVTVSVTILTWGTIDYEPAVCKPPETEWNRTFGGTNNDHVLSVVPTSDGGWVMLGHTQSSGAGDWDVWLVKIDAIGNMMWNQTYGGLGRDHGVSVVQTSDGGYAIAGITYSSGAGSADFWLVKTDPSGNMEWNRTYGGTYNDDAYCMIQTSDGGFAILGRTRSFGVGDWDFWLVKTDPSGNMEWNRTYGGTQYDEGRSVIQTDDGGYAIVGWTQSFGHGSFDMWIAKTDETGNMQWNQTYGGTNSDYANSVVQTGDGGYAIAGWTWSFSAGQEDFWLVKTDPCGNMEWNRTYGGTNSDHANSVVQTGDGGYAIAGPTRSFGVGDWDFWLLKTNANGNMLWNQTFGGTSSDYASCVVQTGDGGYAIAGWTQSFGVGGDDFWLIKLAPEEILATVDIDPDTLNLKSNGQWITAYINLPEGYNVEDIILETVHLNGTSAEWSEIQNSTYMAKFDRATVQGSLTNEPDYDSAPRFYALTLTVTGELADGTPFQGTDTIRVLSK